MFVKFYKKCCRNCLTQGLQLHLGVLCSNFFCPTSSCCIGPTSFPFTTPTFSLFIYYQIIPSLCIFLSKRYHFSSKWYCLHQYIFIILHTMRQNRLIPPPSFSSRYKVQRRLPDNLFLFRPINLQKDRRRHRTAGNLFR